MRHVQFIDRRADCPFAVFAMADADFALAFPAAGQDVAFGEDVVGRVGESTAAGIVGRALGRRVAKGSAVIDGTLFRGMADRRADYPNGREADMMPPVAEEPTEPAVIGSATWYVDGRSTGQAVGGTGEVSLAWLTAGE